MFPLTVLRSWPLIQATVKALGNELQHRPGHNVRMAVTKRVWILPKVLLHLFLASYFLFCLQDASISHNP